MNAGIGVGGTIVWVGTVTAPLDFFVPGEPVVKKRPRTVSVTDGDGRAFTRTFTPGKTGVWEHTVRAHAMRAAALARWAPPTKEDRFALSLELHLGNGTRKDLDNMLKAIADGLQPAKGARAGGVILDDWQICRMVVERVVRCTSPGVHVRLARTTEREGT